MAGLTYKNGGVYWGKVFSNKLGKTKNDKPQFILQFEIVGEVDPTNPDGDLITCPQNQRTIFQVLSPETLEWFKDDLIALGFEGDRISRLDMESPEGYDFGGKELAFYCKHDVWEGKTREKWSISTGKKTLEVTPLDGKELRALDNLFGRSLKGLAKKPAEARQTAPQRTAATVDRVTKELNQQTEDALNDQLNEDQAIPF